MNRIASFLVALSVTILASSPDAQARGGRGGGGFSRAGGADIRVRPRRLVAVRQ